MNERDRQILEWTQKLQALIRENEAQGLAGLATYQMARHNVERELVRAVTRKQHKTGVLVEGKKGYCPLCGSDDLRESGHVGWLWCGACTADLEPSDLVNEVQAEAIMGLRRYALVWVGGSRPESQHDSMEEAVRSAEQHVGPVHVMPSGHKKSVIVLDGDTDSIAFIYHPDATGT